MGVEACRPSDGDLAEKFRLNADIVLSNRQADSAIDMLLSLDEVSDVRASTEMLGA